MPLHKQTCKDCRREHEEFRGTAEGPRQECPDCGGKLRQSWDKAPTARVGGYSPMHPRALRGRNL
ncbi:MAG: zinc ribbon domain-containing protein [Aureliella sp.]